MFTAIGAYGQFLNEECESQFTHLDWSIMKIDTVLPQYTHIFNVGREYVAYDYEIKIEYPEYKEFTKQELAQIKKIKLSDKLGSEIKVTSFMGESRKEGILDVSFIPIVFKEGKYYKLESCKIALYKSPKLRSKALEASYSTERYAKHSVLSQGKWVKIKVEKEGIYQMTKSFLSNIGFKDISKVKVYGYGGLIQNNVINYDKAPNSDYDDLEEIPLYRNSNRVLFFANGTVRWSELKKESGYNNLYSSTHTNNPYSSYSYYFVTEGDSISDIAMMDEVVATKNEIKDYPEHSLYENDAYSWYSSGRTFYDNYNFSSGSSKKYSFPISDIVKDSEASLSVYFSASAIIPTRVTVSFNGTNLGTMSASALGSEYDHATIVNKKFKITNLQNSNSVSISSTAGNDARLDYIQLNYHRQLKMKDNVFVFSHYLTNPSKMILSGADANTQVWRLGYPGHPTVSVKTELKKDTLVFNVENPSLRYVAFNSVATYPLPSVEGTIANQDLHADSVYDMVIVVPENGRLTSQAERLANVHAKHDLLRVKVVSADKIYNEFSSGTPDVGAVRRYLKMLYDRNEEEADMPKYLFLFGACLWDNRMITPECKGYNPKDFLLAWESDNSVSEVNSYVTDDWYGLLGDGEGSNALTEKIDLGIGRLPVVTENDAKIIVDKTIDYIYNKANGSWKNSIYMIADDADNNSYMEDAEKVAKTLERYYPKMDLHRIYTDAYKRVPSGTGFRYPEVTTKLKDVMNKGALIMNYSGHGSPYCLSHEQFLRTEDFQAFSSANVPIWVVASCEITPYDMFDENIGVESLLNKKGAAIAFFSSARAVYATQNSYINNYYSYYLLSKDKKTGKRVSIGDASRLAKVNLVSDVEGQIAKDRDLTSNKMKYALMGDPALVLGMPTLNVVLDNIDGKSVKGSNIDTLNAGAKVRLSGHIEDENGKVVNDYNGAITISLYDSKDTIVCHNNDGTSDKPFKYIEHSKLIYSGSDSLRAGHFTMEFPVSLNVKYDDHKGRFNFYAISTDSLRREANGVNENVIIKGTTPDLKVDSVGPKMYLYLNSPDFKNGDVVNSTPFFFAELLDSNGINTTGSGIGHNMELIIDGKETTTYNLNNYYINDFGTYASGKVEFMIPELPDGNHQLMFRAWNTKNVSSAYGLRFRVDGSLSPKMNKVTLSRNPAKTSTTFIIQYDRPKVETTFEIKVYDTWGRLHWSHTESAVTDGIHSIDWNLESNNGVALYAGLYIYEVSISCPGTNVTKISDKLIVVKQ